MHTIRGFFRLIRLPNLFFIGLTQWLLQMCVFQSIYKGSILENDIAQFYSLMAASLFIAAGGYIINDYFDVAIDEVNRPDRLVVGKIISRRGAIGLYILCSGLGMLFTCYSVGSLSNYLIPLNLTVILLLWVYSAHLKKNILIGNLLISLLVTWSVFIFFLSKADFFAVVKEEETKQSLFYQICALYAGFAFLSTMAREIMKDIEDRVGDQRHGCRTLPIVWGIPVARFIALIWLILILLLLLVVLIYLLYLNLTIALIYEFFLLIIPLLLMINSTVRAKTEQDFGVLSSRMKWFLLAGVFSIIFFCYYL